MLPVLGVCWLVFLLFPDYLGQTSTVDYAAMTLGVGLMVAGVFRFLHSPGDSTEPDDATDSAESNDRTDSAE